MKRIPTKAEVDEVYDDMHEKMAEGSGATKDAQYKAFEKAVFMGSAFIKDQEYDF